MSSVENVELTQVQKDRMEKNRQRALILKQSRLVSHPYSKGEVISIDKSIIKVGARKFKDTGGGFLLEEAPEKEEENLNIIHEEAPLVEEDRPTCENCEKVFISSWLFETYDCKICNECKDPEVHKLITKTEAKNEYLLKDCDIDKREPILKFITRQNPHNPRWGEMKLYLQIQIEQRALDVWGSEENLEKELESREEKKVLTKSKKYKKQMKELRMKMRSSLYDRTTSASHTHEFGEDTYNEESDDYTHVCKSCGFEDTFEKM